MTLDKAKLALSGGSGTKPFFDSIFEMSGTDTPTCVIDASSKTNDNHYTDARIAWSLGLQKLGMPEPMWLQDSYEDLPTYSKTSKLLDEADVLLVMGGSTRHAYQRWQDSGITKLVLKKVIDGDIVAAGGSAGAMVWFSKGFSDSNQFDVADGEEWDYCLVDSAGLLKSWVTAHHSDIEQGKLRSAEFANSLAQNRGEWKTAIGIDTNVALICQNGIARVKDLSTKEKPGSGDVYLYNTNIVEPIILKSGESITLKSL